MSEFSDLLSLLIKNQDVNVSALTAYCELDRSTMYKLINGKRAPSSKALVQKLASFMNLNPLETQELLQAYLLTKVGWDTYYSRKNALEFILSFTDLHSESFQDTSALDFNAASWHTKKDTVALSGQIQINSCIHQMVTELLSKPDGHLFILAQPEHLEVINLSAMLPYAKSTLHIQHIICVNNRKGYIRSQQNYNMQCLKKIISLYEKPVTYEPYYYYDNVNSHFNNLNFLPCMFLTDSAAILCSSNLKEGVMIKDKETLHLFENRFRDIMKNTEPLTSSFHSILNFHLKNFSIIYKEASTSYSLSAEPCLIPCFTKDLLNKYIPDSLPQKNTLLQELPLYIESLTKSSSHMYFTREGVLRFLMTGRLHEIPDALYSPFEYEDRIKLLKKFYDQVNSSNNIRLLKGSLEKFPLNLHLAVTVNYGYLMFSGQTSMLTYILLKEQNLLSSFYDFASSLDEMEMLETKDETLNYLQRVIEMNKDSIN